MPPKNSPVITCLNQAAKEALLKVAPELRQEVENLPFCSGQTTLEIAEVPGVKKKAERKRSAYQQFISDCMKAEPIPQGKTTERLQSCAREWREGKGV